MGKDVGNPQRKWHGHALKSQPNNIWTIGTITANRAKHEVSLQLRKFVSICGKSHDSKEMLLLFQMIGATGGAVCEGRITTCSEPVVIHQQPATRQLQLPPSTCHFYQATNLRTGFILRTFTKGIPLGSVALVMGPWQYMRYEMTK